MKNRSIFSLFTVILVIFGLFTACSDPSSSNSSSSPNSNPFNPASPNPNPPQSVSNYTVKFEANGGDPVPDSQNIVHGEKVVPPSAMAKTGYGFGGWYKERACTNEWNFATNTVTGNITLYAQWDVNYHTVNFNANDGSPAPNQQTIAYGGKVVRPSAITKTGYGFGGWYKEADCINQWDFTSNTVNDDITLYAKWDMNYYTVKFNTNGGSPVPNSQSITHNGMVVQPSAMTKTGYGFGGWYKEAACTNEWDFATDTVTGNITLYVKWNINYYTVSFNADGGSPVPNSQNIAHGGKVATPSAMTKTGYSFGGWYKEAACTNQWNFATDSVTGEITLYAKWNPPIIVPGDTLAAKLQWLSTNAASNSGYILEVTVDEELNAQNLSYSGKSNITIQLQGTERSRVITLFNRGSLFSIGNGVTLILEKNLILKGNNSNNASLVQVNSSGTLIMNQGVKITGNKNSSTSGGGVYVSNNGTFTMSGGEISGNTSSSSSDSASSYSGGVYVAGTFTMNGGKISGNTTTATSSYISSSYGGGVYVYSNGNGTFTKPSDGIITGYASDAVNGNVVKKDGVVQSNRGHAVYVDSSPAKYRETTAGPGVYLNSRLGGTTGGWEN